MNRLTSPSAYMARGSGLMTGWPGSLILSFTIASVAKLAGHDITSLVSYD